MADNPLTVALPFGNAAIAQGNFVSDIQDSSYAWAYGSINQLLWDEVLPYQLTFYERQENNIFLRRADLGSFTLPIPPTDLTRGLPAAIRTTATLGGIIEEHNGSPIRTLTFSGTTGILPIRTSLPSNPSPAAIFGGVLKNVLGQVLTATSDAPFNPPNLIQDSDFDTELPFSTGYYQFRLLEKFIEHYLWFKKQNTIESRNISLAIEIHKDEAVYLASLTDFTLHRSASSNPLEYTYTLTFKTWRKILDTTNTAPLASQAQPATGNDLMATALNYVTQVRNSLYALNNVLSGFAADADSLVNEPLRQVALFAKGVLGVTLTCADLPPAIILGLKPAILSALSTQASFNDIGSVLGAVPKATKDAYNELKNFAQTTLIANTNGGQLASAASALTTSAAPANKILNNPQDYYGLFSLIQPSNLQIAPVVQQQITQEQNRIARLTRLDFQNFRDQILTFSTSYANSVGAGNAIYNQTFSANTSNVTRTPTLEDFIVLDALNTATLQLNQIVATPTSNTLPDPLAYVSAAASPYDIQVRQANSKIAIPFPYGNTLEMIAARYLNDPQRWIEIATINNLQEPYVDEEGFTYNLLVNANQNEITVPTNNNLYIGQPVSLVSTTQLRTYYRINAITQRGTTYVLQLNTNGIDLNNYKLQDRAQLHAYLPNTINAQQLLYIPSDLPNNITIPLGKPNNAYTNLQAQLSQGGADLLLNPTDNDLIITPTGNAKLAIGLANKIQKLRLTINTPRGTIIEHPQYGFPLEEGQSLADLSANDVLRLVQNTFTGDPTIQGVEGVQVQINGPTTIITFSIIEAVTGNRLPVAFAVN